MDLRWTSKAASFGCLDDIRPKTGEETDGLGYMNHTERNFQAVILTEPAGSDRMEPGMKVGMHSQFVVDMHSQSVVGMLDPVEAGDSLVEHLILHTGPGNAGSAAAAPILQLAEATNHNLDSGQSGDQDH